jgi:RTA1 like protein
MQLHFLFDSPSPSFANLDYKTHPNFPFFFFGRDFNFLCSYQFYHYLLTYGKLTITLAMVSPQFPNWNPNNWITYGPDENCNLNLCPVEASIFKYRPSLAANSVFIALFGVSLLIHLYQGIRWRTWGFMTAMFLGCVCEMVGYGGRILMWKNPFSFQGFITQIGEFPALRIFQLEDDCY